VDNTPDDVSNYKTTYYFRGKMDEFIMFRRALSDNEIKALYEAGNPY
jgi:hypothetical protein